MTVSVANTTTIIQDIQVESGSLLASNAAFWSADSTHDSTTSTPSGMASFFLGVPETSIAQQVFQFYEGILGRKPDAAGMQFYVAQAEAGLTPDQIGLGTTSVSAATWNNIASEMLNSPEGLARFPAGLNAAQNATSLYTEILHRVPSSAEVTFYTNALANGLTMNQAVQNFIASPEFQNDTRTQVLNSMFNAAIADVNAGTGAHYNYGEIAFGHSSSAAVETVGIPHSTHGALLQA